jgi:hypothetical protein
MTKPYICVRTKAPDNGIVMETVGPFETWEQAHKWATENAILVPHLGRNAWQVLVLRLPDDSLIGRSRKIEVDHAIV